MVKNETGFVKSAGSGPFTIRDIGGFPVAETSLTA